ncbi:MAG: HEAT repeat domain-containing protein [Planctomycetes bacterium]|nr:HEAT repeat domain-containing protein [Planctomycetota bacterium]
MRSLTIAAVAFGGSLIFFSSTILGHGGTYRGPGDTVPPSSGGPSTPNPGHPNPSNPTTPGPSHPVGPNPTTPTNPPVTTPPGTPGPGRSTGSGLGPDLESWTFWWSFNRDRFLNLKSMISKLGGPITGDDEGLVNNSGRRSMRPTLDQITNIALPALNEALAKETNRDLITGALLAIAKIGQEPQRSIETINKFLNNPDQEIAETACLALGILASPEGVPALIDLFEDNESARKLVDKREVPIRTRTFAAYGLGLVGARSADPDIRMKVQSVLLTFIGGEGAKRTAQIDLRVATVVSLGLIKDPERKAAAALEKYYDDNYKRETIICAHVPNAIARILGDAPANERGAYVQQCLAELASDKRNNNDKFERQSMAQAVGMLTRSDDTFAKHALEVLCEKIDHETSRNPLLAYFGMISLGEIAGTANPDNDFEKYLLVKAQTMGGRVMTRAWAAVALGVEGFEQLNRKDSVLPNPAIGKALLGMTIEIKDPEQLGAYAIGLGLLHYNDAREQMEHLLDVVKSDEYRGFFATSLGLMGETNSMDKIRDLAKKSTRRPDLVRECTIALGLLGDKSAVPTLLEVLGDKENKTLAVHAAVATALGFVGDYRAIDNKDSAAPTLPRMLRDKSLAAESRAFAAVAIGIVCDKEELPWNFKISSDLNYTAATATLNDYAGSTGILNIL